MSCSDEACGVAVYVKQALRIEIQIVEPNDTDPELMDEVDVSSASSKLITALSPSNTLVSKTASFLTDGTDGWIYADFDGGASGDFNAAGDWTVQGLVVISSKHYITEPLAVEVLATNWSVSGTALP